MFDPRVQMLPGQDANIIRRVWNHQNVEWAYEAYKNGDPLIAVPFITGEPTMRRPGILYDWSDWELQEAIKCKKNIKYFAKHYAMLYRPDSTYGLVELYPFQIDYLEKYQNNRYLIWLAARQSGKTTTVAIALLWSLIFGENQKIALIGDKLSTSQENLNKIRSMYELLPFWLKPGVTKSNTNTFAFENGNYIFAAVCNLGSIVGKTLTCVYFDEFAIPDDKLVRDVYEFVAPTISRMESSKMLISSSARSRDHLFAELWLQASAGNNPFATIRTDWWNIPGRDEKWKQEQIGVLGSERAFDTQFGNQFRSGGSEWLSAEASEYMDELIAGSKYEFLRDITDREDILSKLSKVEAVIMKSKYVNKSTLTPEVRLLDCVKFDTNQVSITDLKTTPLIFTIDSGEGRLQDFTIVNIFRPEFDDDKQKIIDEANAEIEAEVAEMFNENESDEDSMFDAMSVDGIDIEELDGDFVLANGVRCRQVGIIYSNQHSMAMVALFVQIFIKSFCNDELCKIVCELDGLGSLMQQYLAMDIVKNSGLDLETFASCDENNKHPGIYMRGRNKLGYVAATESLIDESRILCSYAITVYEMRKFSEVKPNKWEGVSSHDDHTLSVVQLGGYMTTQNFVQWVEDVVSEDETINADDEFDDYLF